MQKRPAAENYGAIGSIIGHEISHTFDQEGSAFDSKGRVRNWWTPEDSAHFNQAAVELEKQYDAYEVFPGLHVNGKQTIDENIADLGGVAAAYDGYRASLHGIEAPAQDGFSDDAAVFYRLSGRTGARRSAKQRCGTRLPPTHIPPRSFAPTSCATRMRGTRPSTSSRATSFTWRRPIA